MVRNPETRRENRTKNTLDHTLFGVVLSVGELQLTASECDFALKLDYYIRTLFEVVDQLPGRASSIE